MELVHRQQSPAQLPAPYVHMPDNNNQHYQQQQVYTTVSPHELARQV